MQMVLSIILGIGAVDAGASPEMRQVLPQGVHCYAFVLWLIFMRGKT